VSIYKGALEKAFIEFNATNSGKENWFTPERILNSSWADLKTTPEVIMSLSG